MCLQVPLSVECAVECALMQGCYQTKEISMLHIMQPTQILEKRVQSETNHASFHNEFFFKKTKGTLKRISVVAKRDDSSYLCNME